MSTNNICFHGEIREIFICLTGAVDKGPADQNA